MQNKEYHNRYEETDLHRAAKIGDLSKVKEILVQDSKTHEIYKKLTPLDGSIYSHQRQHGGATALHYALINDQYEVAEKLLQHSANNKIINTSNSATESILQLIINLPDKEKAFKLAKIALSIKGINTNFLSSWSSQESALSIACKRNHLKMVDLLLQNGADPNVRYCDVPASRVSKDTYFFTLLIYLAKKLKSYHDQQRAVNILNALILNLIEKGADPNERDSQGKNFFDFVIDQEEIKLDPKIKEFFQTSWKKSSADDIKKAQFVYQATAPFFSKDHPGFQSPSLEDTALLVNLKKERRLKKSSDYNCTVLYGRKQLDSFILLARLCHEATHQAFQTQFIVKPRENEHERHVANGQLRFDINGHINVFWIDSLGHEIAGDDNKVIGKIIQNHLPHANLYTVDTPIQSTRSGCHHIAMYLSERFSAIEAMNIDLFGDLNKIHQVSKKEYAGFRVIPWEKCPAYTGVPRIIQSASKPMARLNENVEADKIGVNRKGQTYKQAIEPFLIEKNGKIVNMTYEAKRKKFGIYITQAYQEYDSDDPSQQLAKKKFLGFTDIVDRVPIDALADELGIRILGGETLWEIRIPELCKGKYLTALKGTQLELAKKLDDAYSKIVADTDAIKSPEFHFQYAAIRATRIMVDNLKIKQDNNKHINKQYVLGNNKIGEKFKYFKEKFEKTRLDNLINQAFIDAKSGDIEGILILKEQGVDLNRQVNKKEKTLAMVAVRYGHMKVLCKLKTLDEHLDLKQVNKNDETLPMIAVRFGHVDVLNTLHELDKDLDFKRVNKKGMTLAMIAIENNHPHILSKLKEFDKDILNQSRPSDGLTPIIQATINSDLIALDELGKHAADFNKSMKNGMTAAFIAAAKDNCTVLSKIRQFGVDINTKCLLTKQELRRIVHETNPAASERIEKKIDAIDPDNKLDCINFFPSDIAEILDNNKALELINAHAITPRIHV